jgi:gamma-tubulin complex component 3
MPTLVNPPQLKTQTHLTSAEPLAPQEGKTLSKAEALRDFRIQKGNFIVYRSYAIPTASVGISHLPEPLLFRDALYLMQGISGKYVRFVLPDDGDKRIVFGNDLVSAAAFSLKYLTLIFAFFCL